MSVRDETAPKSVRGVSVEDTAFHAIDVSQPNDRCARGHMLALRRLLLTAGLAPTAVTLDLSEGGEVPRTRMTDAYDVFMSDRLAEIEPLQRLRRQARTGRFRCLPQDRLSMDPT